MSKKIASVSPLEDVLAYLRIQYFFFDYPAAELSLNDLCSAIKISKTTANRVVEALVKEGFLIRKIIGKLWRISCNVTHHYNITRKMPYHLGLIYESGVMQAVHTAIPQSKCIVLFGSYRKGDDTDKSDIDIAVEVISDEDPKILELGNIPILGYRQNVLVNLHIYTRNRINLNLFANIANGIVLEGFLEVRP